MYLVLPSVITPDRAVHWYMSVSIYHVVPSVITPERAVHWFVLYVEDMRLGPCVIKPEWAVHWFLREHPSWEVRGSHVTLPQQVHASCITMCDQSRQGRPQSVLYTVTSLGGWGGEDWRDQTRMGSPRS